MRWLRLCLARQPTIRSRQVRVEAGAWNCQRLPDLKCTAHVSEFGCPPAPLSPAEATH